MYHGQPGLTHPRDRSACHLPHTKGANDEVPKLRTYQLNDEILCDGQTSYLEYKINAQGRLDLWHTEVPVAQRGRGFAKLVRQAFRYTTAHGLKVEVICARATFLIVRYCSD